MDKITNQLKLKKMSLTKSKESIDEAISLLRQMEHQIEIYKYMIARLTVKHGYSISQTKGELDLDIGFRFTKLANLEIQIAIDKDVNYNYSERINKLINQ